MEQEKQKKSTFEKVVVVFNIIAVILMIGIIIISLSISEELSNKYGQSSLLTKLDAFNNKFMAYEGIITGSQVKKLIKIVNESNVEHEGTDEIISINGNIGDNQYVFTGESNKKYKVTIEKTDGIVSNIIINDIEEVDNCEISNNYTNTENNINKINTQKKSYINFISVLFDEILNWIPIFLPFIIINIVVYFKCKSNAKKMRIASYDYEDIKERQIFLLLILLLTDIVFCIVSYFWLKHLEYCIMALYSCT